MDKNVKDRTCVAGWCSVSQNIRFFFLPVSRVVRYAIAFAANTVWRGLGLDARMASKRVCLLAGRDMLQAEGLTFF